MRRLLLCLLLILLLPHPVAAARRSGIGQLRVLDGDASNDRVTLELYSATLPDAGTHYQAWLGNDAGTFWQDVGTLAVSSKGRASLEWRAPDQQNLAATYSQFKITVERDGQPAASPSAETAYMGAIDPQVLPVWRALLVSGPDTPLPSRPGLASQLKEQAKGFNDEAKSARDAMRNNQRSRARSKDELLLNRIVGVDDASYGDWDGDGTIENESDTYGILRYTATIDQLVAPLATSTTLDEDTQLRAAAMLKTSAAITDWSNQTRNLASVLSPTVNTTDGLEVQRDIVWLSKLTLDGFDANLDGTIERNDGEGGARGLYRLAQDLGRVRLEPQ